MTSEYVVSAQGITANLTIGFAVNSTRLLPEGRSQLDEVGRAIVAGKPNITFLIEGHASSEGRADRNNQLSQERAAAARDYLVSRFGLSAVRFEARGLGSSQPVMEGEVENRVKSRRVALIRRYSRE
jgi:OOP family OmpA-OmpF porin